MFCGLIFKFLNPKHPSRTSLNDLKSLFLLLYRQAATMRMSYAQNPSDINSLSTTLLINEQKAYVGK